MSQEALQHHYDAEREWMRQNGAAYEAAVQRVKDDLPEVFLRVAKTLFAVNAEDKAIKSVWAVAQTRMIMQPTFEDARLVQRYEMIKKNLAAFDAKVAAGGA